MRRSRIFLFLLFQAFLPRAAAAQYINVYSDYVAVVGDILTQGVVFGTSPSYTPANADLSFNYNSLIDGATITTHMVFLIDGTPRDMHDTTLPVGITFHAVGSGLGAYLEGSRIINNVECYARYEIVNNVLDNAHPDMFRIRFVITNHDSVDHSAACRFELDTMVNGNDGTNISVDNGSSVITIAQAWRANLDVIPSDWWDYDVDPHTGIPLLVGRCVVYNNPYGDPSTMPDCLEVVRWGSAAAVSQWSLGNIGASVAPDSAVVFWWTGSGDETGNGYILGPGQSVTFTTHYGLNAGVLLATPTPTGTPQPTFTPTPTATWNATPPDTPTPSLRIWPNPYVLSEAVRGTVKVEGLPPGGRVRFFTVAGELVADLTETHQRVEWDGKNREGRTVAGGTYYYLIEAGDKRLMRGKLIIEH